MERVNDARTLPGKISAQPLAVDDVCWGGYLLPVQPPELSEKWRTASRQYEQAYRCCRLLYTEWVLMEGLPYKASPTTCAVNHYATPSNLAQKAVDNLRLRD